ncbi:MAG: hypothetical protein GY861_28260 [bacterium]|nr:hypothetical protein [bacterium]
MQKDALDKKNEAEAKAAAEIAAAQEAAAKIESDRIAAQIADTQTRIKIQQDLIKEIENVNEEVKAGLIDGNGELEKEQALRVALSELISEGFTVQGQGFKNIIAAAEEFNVVLTDQKEGTEENTEAQDKYYESVDDFYKKLIQESKFGKEAVTKDVDEIELSWESMTDVATDSVSGFFDIFGQLSENRKNVELEAIDEVLQAELAANDLKLGTKIDALNELSDAEVAFNDFTRDAKIKSLEEAGTEESRLELAALLAKEDRIDELEGYEKDYLDAKTKAKEDADEKEKEIKRDAAKRDRLLALFDITIATAAGIAEAIPNWPLVIAAGAAGTVQTGIVLATPVPSFAQGGIVAGNDFVGDHVPAFVNSGEMILNRNQQARLFELANSGGTTNNTSNNSVNINSMFSLGNDAKLNEAAERLFTPLQRVSTRRNASIGGI